MRVLLLTNHLRSGGISSYVINLAKGLEEEGVEVWVASLGGETAAKLKRHFFIPLRTKFIFSFWVFVSFFRLKKLLQAKNFDIVHANTRLTQFLAWLLKKKSSVKTVAAFHGFYRPHLFRRKIKAAGDLNIAVSRAVKEHLIKDLGFAPDKIRVVPSGIDIGAFVRKKDKAFAQKELGIEGYPIIGIVARLAEEKRHLLLLEAFSLIVSSYPQAKLVVAGFGRQEKKIKAAVKAAGLEDKVYFFPHPKVEDVLESLDIFVLPSQKEGFGLGVLEAQAKGVAVVCSFRGGLQEVVKDNETGLFFYQDSAEAIKGAILKLLRDKSFYDKITHYAQSVLAKDFSYKAMARSVLRVYQELAEK